jgi:hypothetical protein
MRDAIEHVVEFFGLNARGAVFTANAAHFYMLGGRVASAFCERIETTLSKAILVTNFLPITFGLDDL